MKLKSKNSFLKRISCIALSLMLCLTSFTLAGFVPTLEAEAATSKEVLHYTFDNGTRYDVNGQNQLSEMTWGSTSNGSNYYYNSDGGVYGAIQGLNGKNNWKLTYIGSSNQDLESAKQEGSCDFGLGTSVGNTDVIRVSSYGHIYSNETLLVQASVTSQQDTTIVFEYVFDQLVVTVNDVSYGPFTVRSDLFQNVNSMYTGINSGKGIGSHLHYVYDIVATTVDNTCVTKADFDKVFSSFEAKFNGTVYRNMQPAYDAYVSAKKVYDAYFYGDDTSINLGDYYVDLVNKVSQMTVFTGFEANVRGRFPNDNDYVTANDYANSYKNLLYSGPNSGTKVGGTDSKKTTSGATGSCYAAFGFYYTPTVMMYDGGTTVPQTGIMLLVSPQKTGWYGIDNCDYACYINSYGNGKGIVLADPWRGTDGSLNFQWLMNRTDTSLVRLPISSSTASKQSQNNDKHWYANFLKFTDTLANNEYTRKVTMSFGYMNSYKKGKSATTTATADITQSPIYIVNYNVIKTAINNNKTKISSIANKKQGGISEILGKFDVATSYDKKFVGATDSDLERLINECNTEIPEIINNLNNATTTSDNSAYDTIRDEIDKYKTIKSNIKNGLNFYKADTLSAYETAYNEAKAVMADVDNNGYKPASNTTPNVKAQALKTARENLKEIFKVTFKNKDGRVVETRDIEPNHPLGELPKNTDPVQNTEAKQHTVYSWPNGVSENTVIQGSGAYYEIAKTEPCAGTAQPITSIESGHEIKKHKTTCSVCDAEYINNHNLSITGTTASCPDCGYSVSSDYNPNGFRITTGNLFDVDAYAATDSATINPNSGAVSVDTVNDTITVAGLKYDAYTNYSAIGNYYRLPVSRLSYYTISYTPSSDNNQVYCFFSDGESGDYKYNEKYNDSKYGAPANQEYKLTFQALESYVDFRFGTVESGGICTFSNISFYESDENGNPTNGYKVLESDVPSGENVLSWLNIPSANKCNASYDMFNNSDAVREGDTVTTNLNITLDTEHTYSGNYKATYTTNQKYDSTENHYTHSKTCETCRFDDTQPCKFGGLVINGNTATLTCSVCGGKYTLDLEAYNKAVADADTSIKNTVAYTLASRNALSSVLSEQDTALRSAKTQAAVDSCTTTIISKNKLTTADSAGVLVLEKYSIKFNVATVEGTTLATDITGTGTYDYGTMVELDLPQDYQTNYVVTSWKKRVQEVDKVVGGSTTKLYAIVNQEATFTVFVNSIATGDVGGNQAVLTLNNKSGKTVDVGIVETNKEQTVTVNINNSTITIGSVELTAPTYSFYTLKGFYIDKTLYSETGGTVTITENTVITPYYDASLSVDIKRALGETFTINGDNKAIYNAKWNQKVTLKSATEVYWYNENDVLLGQGKTYSFYANSEVTIHTAPVVSVQNVDPTASIGYFDYDSTLNKVTVVNNFFVPDGKTVTEAGVILSTKNSTVDALKKQTNGIFKGGPESFTSTGNQIRISVSRTANTTFTMHALAYVVVEDENGKKDTYFAPTVRSITYTAGTTA